MPPPDMDTESPKHRYLDELVLAEDRGLSATTLTDDIPVYHNGFRWRTIVDKNPWTRAADGLRAKGAIDGTVVADGVVQRVEPVIDRSEVTLYVAPG